MRAYKFLDADGCSPFTATRWIPGEWVEAGRVDPCDGGVHACGPADLAWWLNEALWEIELDGEVVATRHKMAAGRGRLVQPVAGYREAARELAEVGAWRSRDRAVAALESATGLRGRRARGRWAARLAACTSIGELAALGQEVEGAPLPATAREAAALAGEAAYFSLHGNAAQAPFVACCSAGHAAAGEHGGRDRYDAAYSAEREFQSAWLVERLDLPA